MNRRVKYNYTTSPIMDMAFFDERFVRNKAAVCELILAFAEKVPGFKLLLGRDYRGRRVFIEEPVAFDRLDLSGAGFYVVDGSFRELAHFHCRWWDVSLGAFNYPSVKIGGLVLAGFDGDWEGYCGRLKVFTGIMAPLWASVQYCPVTNSWSQDFNLHTAHETKIPSLGLVDYFGQAYSDGVFGGWKKVKSALGERAKEDRGGIWVEYADYMRCTGRDFESYRADTEMALLDCDVWGVGSKGEYPIKSKILECLGMDAARFESPELRAIGDAILKIGGTARKSGIRTIGQSTGSEVLTGEATVQRHTSWGRLIETGTFIRRGS